MPQVERLDPAHSIHHFLCGNEVLDRWIHDAALTADRAGTARVYVWRDGQEIVGYFAIVPHVVVREEIPANLGHGAPDRIPAFLLARLALARAYHGRGYGGTLLAAAIRATLAAIELGGGRLIVVDAIDDDARTFYAYFGFRPIPSDDRRLVMKASVAASSIGYAGGL